MRFRPRHTKTRCTASGKLKWRGRLEALFAQADLPKRGHVYYCHSCGYWHVTRR